MVPGLIMWGHLLFVLLVVRGHVTCCYVRSSKATPPALPSPPGALGTRNESSLCSSNCSCTPVPGGLSVDCGGRSLTQVPYIPVDVTDLHLDYNLLRVTCADLQQLTRLETLTLSHNDLGRVDPCTFSHQVKLTRLELVHCSLSSLEGQVFDNLTHLTHLDLSMNAISSLPPSLFEGMPALLHLNLSFNSIARLQNFSFSGLPCLTRLYLNNNFLSYKDGGFPVDAFTGLVRLEVLHVHANHNKLTTGSYPDMALAKLESLKELFIEGVPAPLGAGFGNLTQLATLNFSVYQEKEVFTSCGMYQDMPESYFTSINTSRPLIVNMSNCELLALPRWTFKPLTTLVTLDLQYNRGLGLEGFEVGSEGLADSSLTYLDISAIVARQAYVVKGTETVFRFLRNTKLEVLKVESNYLVYLHPRAIIDLPRTLKYISFRDNYLIDAHFLPTTLVLYNLQDLDISQQIVYTSRNYSNSNHNSNNHNSNNHISTNNNNSTNDNSTNDNSTNDNSTNDNTTNDNSTNDNSNNHNCTDNSTMEASILTRILMTSPKGPVSSGGPGASSRQMSSYGRQMPMTPSNVKSEVSLVPLPKSLLHLRGSHLNLGYCIPAFRIFNNDVFKYFDVSQNSLKCWDGPILGATSLEYFDLSQNACYRVSPGFFANLTALRTLKLNKNFLENVFSSDQNDAIFSTLTRLEELDLSHNGIKSLPDKIFLENIRLKYLYLSGNHLSKLNLDLTRVLGMAYLDLSDNALSGLSAANVVLLHDLKLKNPDFKVNLSGNPLQCSCQYVDFLRFLQAEPDVIDGAESLTCVTPNGRSAAYSTMPALLAQLERSCVGQTTFFVVLVACVLLVGGTSMAATIYYHQYKLLYRYHIHIRTLHSGLIPHQYLKDVYLTYEQEPEYRDVVRMFRQRLDQKGVTYILAEVNFDGGDLSSSIAGAIVGTRKTVVLLTRDIFEDYHRYLELRLAMEHERQTGRRLLVPVLVTPLSREPRSWGLHTYFRQVRHRILFFKDTEQFWAELMRSLMDDVESSVEIV
ncbi:toll-like receptor 4 [Physella acuta]|uniref:toll-like receptor 4 n=1 Tax=Physella acuta TaxID=109671 RepID=UPI0027DE33C0|nr:toll-like receptor 4 [Physella acuta]